MLHDSCYIHEAYIRPRGFWNANQEPYGLSVRTEPGSVNRNKNWTDASRTNMDAPQHLMTFQLVEALQS